MERVRAGVIGVGTMGQRHCRVYSNLRKAQLIGVCDQDSRIGNQVSRQYDVPYYRHVDELLNQVDLVSLTTPTPSHFNLAMHCLTRGVHLLIEKPITETVLQAELLTRSVTGDRVIVQVGHIERFNPVYSELKNVLDDMIVLSVNMRRLSAYSGSNTDVDVISDLMIHDIDLLIDLVAQEPVLQSAYGLSAFTGSVDHAVAHLQSDSIPMLTLTASRITEHKIRTIEATALEAFVEADLLNKTILVHRCTTGEYQHHHQRGVKYRQESLVERIHVPNFEPLFLELQHFVDCVAEGKPPLVPASDGLRALRMAEAIRETVTSHLADAMIKTPRNGHSVLHPIATIDSQ